MSRSWEVSGLTLAHRSEQNKVRKKVSPYFCIREKILGCPGGVLEGAEGKMSRAWEVSGLTLVPRSGRNKVRK